GNDYSSLLTWAYTAGLVLSALCGVMAAGLWYAREVAVFRFLQPPEVAEQVALFCRWLIPGLWPMGAPIATSVSRFVQLFVYLGVVLALQHKNHPGGWGRWLARSRRCWSKALSPGVLYMFMQLGIPAHVFSCQSFMHTAERSLERAFMLEAWAWFVRSNECWQQPPRASPPSHAPHATIRIRYSSICVPHALIITPPLEGVQFNPPSEANAEGREILKLASQEDRIRQWESYKAKFGIESKPEVAYKCILALPDLLP
ncbi:hypothetical protein VOLCADRAFT_94573, partial [Volvox carteri f. nagariensis]